MHAEVSANGPEAGPRSPVHPSTWEIIRYAYLPTLPSKEALKGWLPRFNGDRLLRAIGLGLPALSAEAALFPHIISAQEQPPAFHQQIAANLLGDSQQEDPLLIASNTQVDATATAEINLPELVTSPFFKPKVISDPTYGIVAVESSRITHQYDPEKGWQELEKYIPLVGPKERINNNLRELLNANVRSNRGLTAETNPLGLDQSEVEQYIKTGSDEGLKSFQVPNNTKGEPAFILVTGGSYGLKEDIGNIQVFKGAVKRLNEIDPKIIDLLTIQDGLKAVAGDIPPPLFAIRPSFAATPEAYLGVIKINEITQLSKKSLRGAMSILLEESWHINNYRHLSSNGTSFIGDYRLDDNPGIDKGLRLKQWAGENQRNMTDIEYASFITFGDGIIKLYS